MWKTFFKTLNPSVLICAIVCGLHAFCMDMWLFHIEAPCNFFVACGKLFYGLDLSFLAAYIFYLMTVHYPEAMKKRVIYAAADFPAMAIVTNIENIFVDMADKQNLKIESKDLNAERIIQILATTQYLSSSTMYGIQKQNNNVIFVANNWIEYIQEKEKVWRSFLAELKPLYPHFDSEYLSALASIDQYKFANPVAALVKIATVTTKDGSAQMTFSNGLEKFFIDIYNKSQVLRKVVEHYRSTYEISLLN